LDCELGSEGRGRHHIGSGRKSAPRDVRSGNGRAQDESKSKERGVTPEAGDPLLDGVQTRRRGSALTIGVVRRIAEREQLAHAVLRFWAS
jgi:hypothetical protein